MRKALTVIAVLLSVLTWPLIDGSPAHIQKKTDKAAASVNVTTAIDKTIAPQEGNQSQPEKKVAVEAKAATEKSVAPASTPRAPNTPQALMEAAGIAQADRDAVDYVVRQESGWCATKWEGEYGSCPAYHGTPSGNRVGYGLCQATPAWKMASAGEDWATNPITQLKWCSEHAKAYGGWNAAAEFKRCTQQCYSERTGLTHQRKGIWW
jgi:hypothetical protein